MLHQLIYSPVLYEIIHRLQRPSLSPCLPTPTGQHSGTSHLFPSTWSQPRLPTGAGRSRSVIPSWHAAVRQYAKWRDLFWHESAGTMSALPAGRNPALLGLSRQECGPQGSSDWDWSLIWMIRGQIGQSGRLIRLQPGEYLLYDPVSNGDFPLVLVIIVIYYFFFTLYFYFVLKLR